MRNAIEQVFDYAVARGHIARGTANPARWEKQTRKLLPKAEAEKHHPAMAYGDVPAFMARLRALWCVDGVHNVKALALAFIILNANRMGEVLKAPWSEFDLDARLWSIPEKRMKGDEPHIVPYSDAAAEILDIMKGLRCDQYVFPGARYGKPLDNKSLQRLLKELGPKCMIDGVEQDCTIHGFRSTFSDWAGDKTSFDSEVRDIAIAHVVGDKSKRAYRRLRARDQHRELLAAWADYLEAQATG
jgi:integrase